MNSSRSGIAGPLYEMRFKDMPLEFTRAYLVYPFYLINSMNLDVDIKSKRPPRTDRVQSDIVFGLSNIKMTQPDQATIDKVLLCSLLVFLG